MENIIEFKNVCKKFNKTDVIKNVSFKIKKGSVCGFVGPNGAGKTTIIKLLLGIIPKDKGEINFNAEEKISVNEIGSIVGGPSYYANLDAYKNIQLVAYMKDIEIKKEEILELIDLVGLKNAGKKKVKNYSLGMKQRLSIAMSLVGNPKVLIWDEPINGLDPEGIIEVRQLIEKIHRDNNITFLISSHILNELDKVIDDIILINAGEIMYSGSLDNFLQKYQCDTLEESYITCINAKKKVE